MMWGVGNTLVRLKRIKAPLKNELQAQVINLAY
jgi:hypothetical protein